MLEQRVVDKEKPQDKVATKSQGQDMNKGNSNSTMFTGSKSRYERGLELYKQGKVSKGNSLYPVWRNC